MSIKALETHSDFALAKQSQPSGFWNGVRETLTSIRVTLTSIREGIDLAGEYRLLTSRGMAPEEAARKVFERMEKR